MKVQEAKKLLIFLCWLSRSSHAKNCEHFSNSYDENKQVNSYDENKHKTHNLDTKQLHNKEKNYFKSLCFKYAEVQHYHKRRRNVWTLKAKSTFCNSYANIDRYEFAIWLNC